MVVDHVELLGPLVAGEDVPQVRERAPDLLARRVVEDGRELRLRVGVAGREEGDVVPVVDEAVREQPDDPLDPAVAARRDGEPGRCR